VKTRSDGYQKIVIPAPNTGVFFSVLLSNTSSHIIALNTVYNLTSDWDQRVHDLRKVDHGGQIILWYKQHVTNLARVTVFVVCMSSTKVLV
jgi:hypothetical protein